MGSRAGERISQLDGTKSFWRVKPPGALCTPPAHEPLSFSSVVRTLTRPRRWMALSILSQRVAVKQKILLMLRRCPLRELLALAHELLTLQLSETADWSWRSEEITPIWATVKRSPTHMHVEKHITSHLIERSSALHSCLLAVLILQSSVVVVSPIYNWYPQHGMACLPCLKGSAQRLWILTTFCSCFRRWDGLKRWERRPGWLGNGRKSH